MAARASRMMTLLFIALACLAWGWTRERIERARLQTALSVAQTKLSAGGRAKAANRRVLEDRVFRERTAQLQHEIRARHS